MLLDLVQKFSTDFFSTLSCLILKYLIKEQQQLFETESKTVCSLLQNFTSFIFDFLLLFHFAQGLEISKNLLWHIWDFFVILENVKKTEK